MADNPDPAAPKPGNPDPNNPNPAPAPAAFAWKTQLPTDLANAPSMLKFADTKEGFTEAVKSHLSLEKMLGHEKVPIPKGKDDVEARALFNKALGIPDKPDGYALPDIDTPDGVKGSMFDKQTFAKIVHDNNLTPEQAKNLYTSYVDMTKGVYAKAVQEHQTKVTNVINQLRSEWGDAYQSKVDLGQMVINKFAQTPEMNEYVTAVLLKDPQGIKFLATLGDQFAENKIGDFKYAQHSRTPEEAQKEVDAIRNDPKHPYNNDRAPQLERDAAIKYVNSLIQVTMQKKS